MQFQRVSPEHVMKKYEHALNPFEAKNFTNSKKLKLFSSSSDNDSYLKMRSSSDSNTGECEIIGDKTYYRNKDGTWESDNGNIYSDEKIKKLKKFQKSQEYNASSDLVEEPEVNKKPAIVISESITHSAPDTRDITLTLTSNSDFSKEPSKKPDLIVSETNDFSKEPVEKSKLRLGAINVIERQRPKRSLWSKSPSEINIDKTESKSKDITLSTQKTAEKHVPEQTEFARGSYGTSEKIIDTNQVIKPGLAQEFYYRSTYPDVKLQDPVIKAALIKSALINDLMTKKKYIKNRLTSIEAFGRKRVVKKSKNKKMRKFKK